MESTSDEPSSLKYKLIKEITNDFHKDRIIGSGGFGTVYKGIYEDGKEIAVKVLHNTCGFDSMEFQKEFQNLKGLKHQNIVELVGFCDESEEVVAVFEGNQVMATQMHRALCFEYVHMGSLHDHISDESTGHDWHTRYNIIKGICLGLQYLREELESPVMHLDLKPDNILLDKCMVPKIADFGLSRLFGEDNTRKTINSVGTWGYVPPEFIEFQLISGKFDIFSLGVIITKIMTGREGYNRIADMTQKKFIKLVHENWIERLRKTLSSRQVDVYGQQVKRCIEIAFECMKRNRQERPTMRYIVSNLILTEATIGGVRVQCEQLPNGESISPTTYTPGKLSSELIAVSSRGKILESRPSLMSTLPKEIPLDFLKEITNNFSDKQKIGSGAFGTVYKGIAQDGEVVAVKKLGENLPIEKTFARDVQYILGLKHENIVNLVGYCHEAQKRVVWNNGRYIVAEVIESLLCYEYMPRGNLNNYISGESLPLDWSTRFKIIMGICYGVHFLHRALDRPIVHLSLKPENILLGDNMVPKISDFGVSRIFGEEKTRMNTQNVVGSIGYMAPEYLYRGEVSTQSDIYSLGLLILEIVTGENNFPNIHDKSAGKFIDNVRQNWIDGHIELMYPSLDASYSDQVKICIETGLKCVEVYRRNRPSIVEIMDKLNSAIRATLNKLSVRPWRLHFPFEPKKPMSCSLQLSSKGDDRVAFRIAAKSLKLPLCGIVPPGCIYTLTVTMRKQSRPPSDSSEFSTFAVQSVAVDDDDLQDVDQDSVVRVYDNFFKNAGATAGDEVREVVLRALCDGPAKGTASEATRPTVEVITTQNSQLVSSIDVHPTEPWIMTTHQGGSLRVWDYQTMATLTSFEVTDEPVHEAKFVAREKWIVAGDGDGGIHVYNYDKNEDVTSFDAHDSRIVSLAVHPTHPFLLSSSLDDHLINGDHLIKRWDWENGWECTRLFQGNASRVTHVTFNPDNPDSFASAAWDGTVKIWSVFSDDCNIVALDERVEGVVSVDYFTCCNQRLITRSKDGAAQVWDLETKGFQKLEQYGQCLSTVYLHPDLPIIITGSFDGTVRLLNSTTYKPENIYGFNLGKVYAFGYIKGLRRLVVGCDQGIAWVEIPLPRRP